jgi:hypothetical protein
MHRRPIALTIATASLLLAVSTAQSQQQTGKPAAAPNTLTAAEQKAGWKLLFDGTTTTGWRGYKSQSLPAEWHVEDGTLTKSKPAHDIVSTDKYGNFDLQLDWKLARKGNAGVFYRGTEEYDHVYWSAPEYQLLDDAKHPDGHSRLTSAGAAYALYPSPAGIVKPGGQWNSTRIVVRGSHVEHWLNGQKVVEYDLGSPDWEAKVKAAKFAEWPHYGRAARGHIAIQGDHSGTLQLRNVRIRELRS